MAALLKKRALAEYSQTQVIQESFQPPIKKLRLVKKSTTESTGLVLISCLESAKTSNEALQTLLRISDACDFDTADINETLIKLSAHYSKEEESAVRVKILSMLGDIGNKHNTDENVITNIVMEIFALLKFETSHRVIAQGMNSLLKLSTFIEKNANLITMMLELAHENLKDTSQCVQCKSLEIIGRLTISCPDEDFKDILNLIQCYFDVRDARVRAQAFKTLLQLHERGFMIDTYLYTNVSNALKDDFEMVRKVVLDLLCALGNTYPDYILLVSSSDQEIRLIDDAFGKICNSVNDLSMQVRQHAAKLLGSMQSVSGKFLNQTLDKKLMSNMRRKRTAHELAVENLASGEWASGKKWADDKPREVLHADSISLMSSGACGAFVHGLEDEFLEVRSAAVESLCQLSLNNVEFANLCLDFLVDMFNDEIEDVRIKAIDALRQISKHIKLRDDQLETILGALEDCSLEVREGLHRMLASSTLTTTTGLKICVDKILDNLKKYPQDRKSSFKCLQSIGSRHSALVLPLVPQLLSMHPFFDMAESDVDNPNYICILILVLNAAKNSETIVPLLEPHILKHYSYLRDTMPTLVPKLCLPEESDMAISRPTTLRKSLDYVNNIITHLNNDENTSPELTVLFQTAKEHLQRLSEMNEDISGTAQFTCLFIGAQLLMSQLLNKGFWKTSNLAIQESNTFKSNLDQLLLNCIKLQNLFVGMSNNECLAVKQLRLRAMGLNLVYVVKGSNASALAPCHHFLSAVEDMQRELECNETFKPDDFVVALFKELAIVEEPKPGTVARILIPILKETKLGRTPMSNIDIRMINVQIIEPRAQSDSTLKFTAGLVMAVPFEAELRNVLDPSRIRLKVKYPDQRTQIILPRPNHMRPLNFEENELGHGQDIRMLTTVLISHLVWSEACNIEISLAVAVPDGDVGKKRQTNDSNPFLIDVCKPVKVSVSPKPIKRAL